MCLVLLSGCAGAPVKTKPTEFTGDVSSHVHVSVFRKHGLGCDFDPTGSGLVAYDIKEKDKFYDIHLAQSDGSHDVCITCDNPKLPNKHMGAAFWHPSGTYLTFVAEKAKHPGGSFAAIPGFGGFSDIWVITRDGKQAWQLTDTPNDSDHGVLPAHFSRDGQRVAWTERVRRPNFLDGKRQFGWWVIKTADFREGPNGPHLENIKTLTPGATAFYEAYGFSPDGKRLLFCSSFNQPSVWTQQIFTMDSATGGDVRQLTSEMYNEHAAYTPDGSHIVWMSSYGNKNKGTDWWIMNADGSEKTRLTGFNVPKHPHNQGGARWAGFPSFSPDGKRFIGGMQLSLLSQEGQIVMVDLPPQYHPKN
jgi:Tol biopolymer transport system component